MPKKRHNTKYSKPQSTAPASLSSSASGRNRDNHDGHQGRSVNEILADLRRVHLNSQHPQDASNLSSGVPQLTPSVPPAISRILQLPETPAPAPRRPARLDPRGRRLPPGPPPPRSWLSLSRHAPHQTDGASATAAHALERGERLPDGYRPGPGSLIDLILHRIALDWEFQRSYNRYHLYSLPSHVRMALLEYVAASYEPGLTAADLRVVLLPPPEDEQDTCDEFMPDPSLANETITHLDLGRSVGRSVKLREVSDLLFPQSSSAGAATTTPKDSWDAPDATSSLPRPLLPNITHLSLALSSSQPAPVSWRQLLAFATHLPTLTHLSLANWPEPALTPNAKFASVVSPQGRTVQYGGTGLYSHSLDDDWAEAVGVLRRLSKALYGLEWLDLTGCASWVPALMQTAEHDAVDWVGDWGKVSTLILRSGWTKPLGEERAHTVAEKYMQAIWTAKRVERHIRSKRAGRGRRITVEMDAEMD